MTLHLSNPVARRGFTLLETLLVIGLMAMIAGVLIGGSAHLLKGTTLSDPEDALLALLQTLRRESVEKAQVIELLPTTHASEDEPDFYWNPENSPEDAIPHEVALPKLEGVTAKILPPETAGAILLGGIASEAPLTRMRFYPDGTCDRVRLEVSRQENRRVFPIDPLTCAPLPATHAQ